MKRIGLVFAVVVSMAVGARAGWQYDNDPEYSAGSTYSTVTLSSTTLPNFVTGFTVAVEGSGYAVITSSIQKNSTDSITVKTATPYTSQKYSVPSIYSGTGKLIKITIIGTCTAYYVIEGVK